MFEHIGLAFGTLIAIVNPISTAFVFNRLSRDHSTKAKLSIAKTASFTAAAILLIFLIFGDWLLSFFGITIYAFQIAGGLLVAKTGFNMLSKNLRHGPEQFNEVGDDIAIIPVAIPMLSGPGAMAAVLVMRDLYVVYSVIIAILLVALLSWFVLRNASIIDKVLGRAGTNVVEKVLGLIVLVIAVQFILNGLTTYIGLLGFT